MTFRHGNTLPAQRQFQAAAAHFDNALPEESGYDLDEAYAAVAEQLVKADDVAELVQDVAEARKALEWAAENAPRELRNALTLLHLQAKKLAKAESDWGTRNAA